MNSRSGAELRFGYPIYHKDLINKNESQSDCLGGGKWDVRDGDIILYGSSDDFGAPVKRDLEEAIKNFCDWGHLEWICEHIFDEEIHLTKKIIVQ